jgi:hypothetical protein
MSFKSSGFALRTQDFPSKGFRGEKSRLQENFASSGLQNSGQMAELSLVSESSQPFGGGTSGRKGQLAQR